jgi:hypothetical protein
MKCAAAVAAAGALACANGFVVQTSPLKAAVQARSSNAMRYVAARCLIECSCNVANDLALEET